MINDILSEKLIVSNEVYKRCLEIKNNLIELPIVLSSDKITSLSQLKDPPWCYEELDSSGYYKGKCSIRLTDKDRLIFKDNYQELIIFEELFHYLNPMESFEKNIQDEDDIELLSLLKDYLSDENLRQIIEALFKLSQLKPYKIWFF